MGLDMYLYAEKRFGFCSWDKEGKDNEKFEKLVTEQIGAKSFPTNFLKMIQNDE